MQIDGQASEKAQLLRRSGLSYADIARELKVSKASVCGWVKNMRLTEAEKLNLRKNLVVKIERGRQRASISIRSKKVFREKLAFEEAEREFVKLMKDSFFLLGVGLCTAPGVKKGTESFQFTSSDPEVMKIFLKWVEKYLNIPRKSLKPRLFLAISHKEGECVQFWARTTGIPVTSFQKTVHFQRNGKKSKEYKGSLAVPILKIEVIRRVIAWQKLTIRYYG